jgi:hypothetical protein
MKAPVTAAVDELVRGPIAALLKSRGFRRKGQRFWRPAGPVLQLVEIERWKYNAGDTGGFGAWVGVFVPQAWEMSVEAEPELADQFSATEPPIQNCHAQLGLDAPPHQVAGLEGYWPIAPGISAEETGRRFTAALQDQGLAWLEQRTSLDSLIAGLEPRSARGEWLQSSYLFFIACAAGNTATARTALARVLERPVRVPTYPASVRDAYLRIAARYGVERPARVKDS